MVEKNNGNRGLSSAVEAALEQAASKVIQRAKQTGTPVLVWQAGRVEEIPSERLLTNVWRNSLAIEHRAWLAKFDPGYLRNWERLLKSSPEAALTEAAVRQLLEHHGADVQPFESLTGDCKQPDFRCTTTSGRFYVEVTHVTLPTVESSTGVATESRPRRPFIAGFLDAVRRKCEKKKDQCVNVDGPVLVAVGTFQSDEAMLAFRKSLVSLVLTGNPKYTWTVNPDTGETSDKSNLETSLERSSFLRRRESQVDWNSISGILFCAVTLPGKPPLGVLHPNAARPFDPALLPGIEFGTVEHDPSAGQLHVRWPTGTDD